MPASKPDDVSLALAFAIGDLAPDATLTATLQISLDNIAGLRQVDPDSNYDFYLNGYATVSSPSTSGDTPEPATLMLIGLGLAGVAILKRRSMCLARPGRGRGSRFLPLMLGAVLFWGGASLRADGLVLTKLATVSLPNSANGVATLNQYAYVCTPENVVIVDFSNPAQPHVVTTFAEADLVNASWEFCKINNGYLYVLADTGYSWIPGTVGQIGVYDLSNPISPKLVTAFATNRRFIQKPVFSGNLMFFSIREVEYDLFFDVIAIYGDVMAIDISNPANPSILGSLLGGGGGLNYFTGNIDIGEQSTIIAPDEDPSDPVNGVGMLNIIDITNPAHMGLLTSVPVPTTNTGYVEPVP